jgi:predicted NUDIX family NTP pyrophosphohydrolase
VDFNRQHRSLSFAIMPKRSAGLLLFRRKRRKLELLLVHPGGPFWAKKDDGAWSIPKGLYEEAEDPFAAAQREFEEETGCPPPAEAIALGHFKQPGGKMITAFAAEGDFDLRLFRSNLFAMEWPPKSGKQTEFPEADRAGWFTPTDALRKVTKGQVPIVQTLLHKFESPSREETV